MKVAVDKTCPMPCSAEVAREFAHNVATVVAERNGLALVWSILMDCQRALFPMKTT